MHSITLALHYTQSQDSLPFPFILVHIFKEGKGKLGRRMAKKYKWAG